MFRRHSELPRGYRFTDPSLITADEAVALFKASGYIGNSKIDDTSLQEWDEALQDSLAIVGIRDRQKSLVGLGTIFGDTGIAGLNHLVVHPDHQHQGLGSALVKKRVKIADEMNVQKLDALLISTNTLGRLYTELGFKALDERTVRREK